jgi:hypothetical protein
VPRDSLASDFFDPAAVGYAEADLEAELDALDGEVYWLGQDFSGSTSLPSLTFDHVWSPAQLVEELRQDSSYVVILRYREAENPFSDSVALHQHRRDPDIEEYFGRSTKVPGRCTSDMRRITLPDGYALIFGEARIADGGVCPAATHYEASAFVGDTIVSVIVSANTGHPFDSAEGMEHLLRGLRLRD